MAAATVGGAFLSSFIGVLFDRLSSPEVVNWIRGKKPNQKLLGALKTTLYAAEALLNDAERRQIKETAVKDWLDSLKDAVYKADDLLDEVFTKAATQKDAGNFWSRYLNLQDREMANSIEDIVDTLELIAKQKDTLGLKEIPIENTSWRIPSTSLAKVSDIYGRDEDRETIVKLLLDDTNDDEISVIPIVGMGGIGKTALARLVYSDDKVKQKFDFKAWVCVGESFDVLRMTQTVLGVEAKTSISCNMNDLDSVQLNLKEKLIGKKFLVVLDDVWNDNYDGWKIFQNPFQYGSEGSKILITTRNDKVASVVQTVPSYKLSLLSDEYCWLVFAKHAFLSTRPRDYSALEKVGRKIVEKCKGLPLAAQTLGGLLRAKDNVWEWNDILKSEIWEFSDNESRILPALRISYHYLPSYLKRCFVYCSLYPKDYQFDRDELTLLWMAEDLLQSPKSGSTLEEIGYKYFNDLASRSFFQASNNNEKLFVMHDLMHDLATFYAGQFYFRAPEVGSAPKVDIKTRHLSYNVGGNYPVSKFLETCDSLKHARTLLQINFSPLYRFSEESASCFSLLKLKCLRVLSLKTFPHNFDTLPHSIGELIHLRYLDLSDTPIMTLPESLGNLYNLQTLKLGGCNKLKMLPSSMQDLVNLRHLDIRRTHLQEMPKGMNKLKDLQFLSDYVIGKHEESGIRELGALASLRGLLSIVRLENVIYSDEASEARINDKKHIDILHLRWSSDGDIADSQTIRDILHKLQPHRDLKELSIWGYKGTIFPDWLGHSSYHNMTKLNLQGCRNCCKLPSLGQLPSLKHLSISYFDGLESIGAEFYKNDESCQETPFPSLETVRFIGMSCWQVWHSSEFDAFPQLKQLEIYGCPLLKGDLPNHLPNLEELTIDECKQLACSLPRTPTILKLSIRGKHKIRIQELPLSLCSLSISGSQLVGYTLEAITHTQPTCLQSLSISNCSSVLSFPWACMLASLQKLQIHHCKKFEFPMQYQLESLQSLTIFDSCDSLASFPPVAFPNLTTLKFCNCENMKCLVVSQAQSQDVALPSLRYLSIIACPNFVSLLSQSCDAALPSLHYLSICDCPNFVSLFTLEMVAPQLEHLRIENCLDIDSFTEGGLPPNLRELHIIDCKKLVRCLASMDLRSHGLTYLELDGACDSIKSFPKEGCLPASLEYMYLQHFPSLETLDCRGLLHLTSLSIFHCCKLENMVGERLPASLMQLSIFDCPLLGKHYQGRNPQIWPKIFHIHDIIVDGRRISDPRS